jgi:hypothetical protein
LANTKFTRGIDRFRRGRAAVRTEWRLITATHTSSSSTDTPPRPRRPVRGQRARNRRADQLTASEHRSRRQRPAQTYATASARSSSRRGVEELWAPANAGLRTEARGSTMAPLAALRGLGRGFWTRLRRRVSCVVGRHRATRVINAAVSGWATARGTVSNVGAHPPLDLHTWSVPRVSSMRWVYGP